MSLTLFDPVGSLLRTCLLSALAERIEYSATWRESATPARRSWWVLETWEPRIGEDESLLWPTPMASDGRTKGIGGFRNTLPLAYLAKTGGLRDADDPKKPGSPRDICNSRWVASLMGFPPDWCELPTDTLSGLTETRSCRRSRK